jgi:hypothetical protein
LSAMGEDFLRAEGKRMIIFCNLLLRIGKKVCIGSILRFYNLLIIVIKKFFYLDR